MDERLPIQNQEKIKDLTRRVTDNEKTLKEHEKLLPRMETILENQQKTNEINAKNEERTAEILHELLLSNKLLAQSLEKMEERISSYEEDTTINTNKIKKSYYINILKAGGGLVGGVIATAVIISEIMSRLG